MRWRKSVYTCYAALRGYRFPFYFLDYARELQQGCGGETVTAGLTRLLEHCQRGVPYYTGLLREADFDRNGTGEPWKTLQRLPILRKEAIAANFDALTSRDLRSRKWSINTSGGSTGEPARLIQDRQYEGRSKAISLLYEYLLGCELGEPLVRLWGSERDILGGTGSRKARFFNWLTNTTWMNAFRMTPDRMKEFVRTLNRLRPRLVVAYAQAAYELARYIEREQLTLEPIRAVVTSAGTLYPFMRETIARVFGCTVYNLYGSREVSDIACELPGHDGLWVAPWGNYVEILDDDEKPVPAGEEGNIVVTCLTNYAMPLIRYWIGDRGALMRSPERGLSGSQQPERGLQSAATPVGGSGNEPGLEGHEKTLRTEVRAPSGGASCQVLKHVSGRNVDMFRTRDRTLVDGEYFTHLLYFRPWVSKFQVIQRDYDAVLFKVVSRNGGPPKSDLDDIAAKARLVMGDHCRIDFEFPSELPPHPSGKYRYTISEVAG